MTIPKQPNNPENQKPVIGISACLVGDKVRYDGCHKHNPMIESYIAPYATLLPICPEAAIGMGIPRAPIRLEQHHGAVTAKSRHGESLLPVYGKPIDEALNHFGKILVRSHTNLAGYIWQSRSPSCGLGTTPIIDTVAGTKTLGSGLVAQRLQQAKPQLPMVNDSDLLSPEDCRQFLEAVSHYLN